MHEREVLRAEISQRAKQVVCVGVRVCVCGMASPAHWVCLCINTCVCVCVCLSVNAVGTGGTGRWQSTSSNNERFFFFSFLYFFFCILNTLYSRYRERVRQRKGGEGSKSKRWQIGCVFVGGWTRGGGEVNTGKSNTNRNEDDRSHWGVVGGGGRLWSKVNCWRWWWACGWGELNFVVSGEVSWVSEWQRERGRVWCGVWCWLRGEECYERYERVLSE